jgi:hypothetical protein
MMIVYDPILTSLPHLGLDIGREKGAREGTLKKDVQFSTDSISVLCFYD